MKLSSDVAPKNVTALLRDWQLGDAAAFEKLNNAVYQQLRQIAQRRLVGERSNHTLQPTALVNEAYLRMVDAGEREWKDRAHFFATAALHMRAILVDHARARLAQKRGGSDAMQVTLDDRLLAGAGMHEADFLILDQAMTALHAEDERTARTVELSYFSGLEREDIATVLGVSVPTVDRCLRFGRAWLRKHIEAGPLLTDH